MWRIGLLLLLFSRIESLQCPEGCKCVQTGQISNNVSEIHATYQITCTALPDLPGLLYHLPDPTTQLILHGTLLASAQKIHAVLAEASQALPHLTDFSITDSVVAGDQLIKEFLPFASIASPILRGSGFTQLQILNLSNNTLKYLPVGLFRSCSSLQTLDLSDNLITNFETDTFHPLINLLRLDLRRNRLQALSEDIFRNLTKLLTLDVSHNKISSITPTTFQYLSSLNTLILSSNPLASSLLLVGAGRHLQVVDASLTGIRQAPTSLERTVRTLILKDNQLSAVRCGDLDSYSLLSSIYLDGNHISYVEEDAMGRLELLNELHLSRNTLFQVPRSLPENLFLIDLSFNLIQNLSNSDFLNLSLLKELSLNNNQIRHIGDNSFANLANLRVLDLSRNPIIYLPPFTGLTQLQVLNLSYLTNVSRAWRLGLRTFPVSNPGSIQQLRLEASPALSSLFLADTATLEQFLNLTQLELRFSNLTTLRKDIFILLPTLQKLNLEGNPWHCDREMLVTAEWVRVHVNGGEMDSDTGNFMHCATPSSLHGIPLRQLSPHYFQINPVQNSLETPSVTTQATPAIENAIERIDDVRGGIEKMSNALEDYRGGRTSSPATGGKDNEVHVEGVSSVTANTDGFNRFHTPIDSPVFLAPTQSSRNAAGETRSSHVESTTSRGVSKSLANNTASVPVVGRSRALATVVNAREISKNWTVANSSRDSQSVSSNISSRLVSERVESVPNDENTSDRKESTVARLEANKREKISREEARDAVPWDRESTTPANLGREFPWEDPSSMTADNRTETVVNNTGVGALSAHPAHQGSHPGLIVMGVVSVVLAAAFALMIHHVRRKRRDEGYMLQDQEMDVHSVNFATSELW